MCESKNKIFKIFAVLLLIIVTVSSYALTSSSAADVPLKADQIYDRDADAVCFLRSINEDGTQKTFGTGYVITKEGYMLTAAHVIKGAVSFTAEFENGLTISDVTKVYEDAASDIAVLKLADVIKSDSADYESVKLLRLTKVIKNISRGYKLTYPYITIAKNVPKKGSDVYTIGYPYRDGKIITDGIVSSPEIAVNGNQRMLVTNTLVNGMSGGLLVNNKGQAVGIVSGTIYTMGDMGFSPTWAQINSVLSELKINH